MKNLKFMVLGLFSLLLFSCSEDDSFPNNLYLYAGDIQIGKLVQEKIIYLDQTWYVVESVPTGESTVRNYAVVNESKGYEIPADGSMIDGTIISPILKTDSKYIDFYKKLPTNDTSFFVKVKNALDESKTTFITVSKKLEFTNSESKDVGYMFPDGASVATFLKLKGSINTSEEGSLFPKDISGEFKVVEK